jgi:hypothetical protein
MLTTVRPQIHPSSPHSGELQDTRDGLFELVHFERFEKSTADALVFEPRHHLRRALSGHGDDRQIRNLFLKTARFVLLRWLIVGDLDAFGKEQQLKGAISPRDLW